MISYPRYNPERETLEVWSVRDPYPAGSLEARQFEDMLAVASPVTGDLICAWIRFDLWTLPDGSSLPDVGTAFAYLDEQCRQRATPTPPLRTVPVAIMAVGQTAIPVSPAPTDVNSIVMLVNGLSYAAPRSFTFSPSAALITWAGDFALIPDDEVVLRYI